jgi:uncharacterized protein with FMN-binding domain
LIPKTSQVPGAGMHNPQPPNRFSFRRLIRRLFLSAFVVISFLAYAIQKQLAGPDASPVSAAPGSGAQVAQQPGPTQEAPAAPPQPPATEAPSQPATAVPTQPAAATAVPIQPTVQTASGLKDGTYTGAQEDAFYGIVQVQTTIHSGKIASVHFLQYPSDRRTSQRINNFAMPYLQQEAIQAQSANVDMISGATLTSQAFIQSLQTALQKARG